MTIKSQRQVFDDGVSALLSAGLKWSIDGSVSLGTALEKSHKDWLEEFIFQAFETKTIASKKVWEVEALKKYIKALIHDNLLKRWEYNKTLIPPKPRVAKAKTRADSVKEALAKELQGGF